MPTMTLPDRTLCWVEGPPWDRYCEPVTNEKTNEFAEAVARCKRSVLEDLEQFVSDQPDTGRYEEDEGKCIWALNTIARFREKENL